MVKEIDVISVGIMTDTVGFFTGQLDTQTADSQLGQIFSKGAQHEVDFSEVSGQEMVKRSMTIPAAGGHNLLMIGPPRSDKTMFAGRVLAILPSLTVAESIETT